MREYSVIFRDTKLLGEKHNIYYARFEVFTAVTMKNGVLWILRFLALVRTDVSEERSASFIRVTTDALFIRSVRRLLFTTSVVPTSPIHVTLMKEMLSSSETSFLTRAIWRNTPGDAILQYFLSSIIPRQCQFNLLVMKYVCQ
jgi:hypothetical protein